MSGQAFIPDVLPLTKRHDGKIANFKIIWKPLFTCGTVEEQLSNLAATYPASPCVSVEEKKLDAKSAVLHFMSTVITRYVKDMNFMHKRLKNSPPKESLAFFCGNIFQVLSLAEKSMPKSISKYFGVFDLMKTDFEVSVHINQLIEEPFTVKMVQDDLDLGLTIVDTYTMGLWLCCNNETDADSLPVRTYMKYHTDSRNQVLKFLSTLVPYLKHVDRLMITDSVPMSSNDLEAFLLETMRIFTNLGVKVVLPKELKKLLKPKAVIHADSKESLEGASHQSFFRLDELLSYNWKIAIGNELITPEEFEKLVRGSKRLVKFKDKYLLITPEEMKSILSSVEKPIPKTSALDLLKESLVEDSRFQLSSDVDVFLRQLTRVSDQMVPMDLNATLREYQVSGFKWMVSNLQHGFGVILADDMGLGKTIQTITTILHLKKAGQLTKPVLLVMPTSVMSNWEREVQRFAPSLTTEKYYGAGRNLPVHGQGEGEPAILNTTDGNVGCITPKPKRRKVAKTGGGSDIIMTTYQLLWRDVDVLQKIKFGMIVIDEAQHIKNFKSQTFKALKKIKSPMRIALSGTPVENKLSELWSVFEFAIPKYLGTIKDFSEKLAKPIEVERDPEKLAILKSITAPFLMRRLKTDKNIIKDLPDKVIDNKYVNLSTEQAVLYESVVQEMLKTIMECKERGERNKFIFKVLTHLKQICNHPANYISSKKVTVESSGKMKMLVELLEPILQQGEKVLIFTQYVQMIKLMTKMLENHFHIKPLSLEGSMSQTKRDEVINSFKTQPHQQVFIISLKAGGTGLNLTEANHVIHYDLWYNPAVENQATDRAFRIGQNKTVFVHRMITEKTFEEKIDQMLAKKKDLSDLSVNVGEQWLGNMTDGELRALFARE
ncbi:putative ATP-dependent helicase/translocase YwqA [Glandiceps talaboti]